MEWLGTVKSGVVRFGWALQGFVMSGAVGRGDVRQCEVV